MFLKRLLSGLRDAPRTTVRFRDPAGPAQRMQWAASRGPILAVIHHQPFPAEPPERFAAVALGAMSRAIAEYRGLRFTTNPAEAGDRAFRVILAFDAPRTVAGSALCRSASPPCQPGDGLTLLAVFCQEDRVLSEVYGSVGGAGLALEAERFRQLMVQTAFGLFRDKG